MFRDPLADWGLEPVRLTDKPVMDACFQVLKEPLSDYTFSQIFTWHKSLRIAWRILENHLCIFANGCGDLTLLLPPLGDTGSDRALARAVEIMDDYNAAHACPDHTRIEYVSGEAMARFNLAGKSITPQGQDYLYDVNRMIDLQGPDLASKRQAKNRFLRNHRHIVERYEPSKHLQECLSLLEEWNRHREQEQMPGSVSATKRAKESLANRVTLECAPELGLRGLVVKVEDPDGVWRIRGFTFGEALGADQSSIVVEKTDLACKGLAQFIFSEFCRECWADRPLVNAGDDWGLETLAWTKSSYRPVKLLEKFVITPPPKVAVAIPATEPKPEPAAVQPAIGNRQSAIANQSAIPNIRPASPADLDTVQTIERSSFSEYVLSLRQLRYLQRRPSVRFLVAEMNGHVVAEGIGLLRHSRHTTTGRIYSLAVDPAHRKEGLGRKLMDELIAALQSEGAQRIYLEVDQSNTAAVRLYEQLGFIHTTALPNYYGPGRHGTRMMKPLATRAAA